MTIQSDFLDEVLPQVYLLVKLGYKLFATPETHALLSMKGIQVTSVPFSDSHVVPNMKSMISNKEVDLVVNLSSVNGGDKKNNYLSRRTAVDFGIPLLTNAQLFNVFVQALNQFKEKDVHFLKVS